MKDKDGKKRKVSFRYIANLIVFGIVFIAFFMVMVFSCRLFDDYRAAEIISVNWEGKGSDAVDVITFAVGGEEVTVKKKHVYTGAQAGYGIKAGDKIYYLANNPQKTMYERTKPLVILSVTEGVILAVIIGMTVYEVKKGL